MYFLSKQGTMQAGYIVAGSTKLAMYPRIWKWNAVSTYLHCYTGQQKEIVLGGLVRRFFI